MRARSTPAELVLYPGEDHHFLGEGAPPEFQTHPEFEHFDGMVEIDSYSRDCNYFQNLENALQGVRIKVAIDVNAASPDVDGDKASALLAGCKGGFVVMAPWIGHQRGIPRR